jgi:hypothetical protein
MSGIDRYRYTLSVAAHSITGRTAWPGAWARRRERCKNSRAPGLS